MKKMKKLFALLIAMVMVLGMSTSVFAATGDITVTDAKKGATYDAYKVFNVVNEEDAVFYTLTDNTDMNTALFGEGTPFYTYTKSGQVSPVYVAVKDGKTDSEVISWLQSDAVSTAIKATNKAATATATTTGGSVTLTTGSIGYYFVFASTGTKSAVIIDTPNETKTIVDKLMVPSIDPEGGKQVSNSNVVDAALGEELTFTVKFTATPQADNGKTGEENATEDVVTYYVFDKGTGLGDITSVSATAADGKTITATVGEKDENGVTTITIPWSAEDHPNATEVTVTYKAAVTDTSASNTASIGWKTEHGSVPTPPDDPDGPTVTVYTHEIDITKVDGANNETKLAGAEFYLKNSEGKYYSYVAATETTPAKVEWVAEADKETKATKVTTDANGVTKDLKGLEAGTYTLVEFKAPTGYNVAEDTEVTLVEIKNTDGTVNDSDAIKSVTVEDYKGSVLPSTGGIGTTIFYVIGAILVIGAGVVLVTRRRMNVQ